MVRVSFLMYFDVYINLELSTNFQSLNLPTILVYKSELFYEKVTLPYLAI